MDSSSVILHISLLDGVGSATIARIARNMATDDWPSLYRYTHNDMRTQFGLSSGIAKKIVQGLADKRPVWTTLHMCYKHGISWASFLDAAYPASVTHMYAPPAILYWRGTLVHRRMISVVGSRKANRYGKYAIDTLVAPLTRSGIAIVSGGAIGADSMAHRAALDAGGVTIAVLGSGIFTPYPASNTRLFDRIVAYGGAVVSPFPLHTEPLPGNFPARNRIIAGLGHALIVAQAAHKSGARITAQHALEQGRDVFAVPGPIDDPLSAGCHSLLREGAGLADSAESIAGELGVSLSVNGSGADEYDFSVAAKPGHSHAYTAESLAGKIVAHCERAIAIDDLVYTTGIPLAQVREALFELQLAGVVQQNAVGMWCRC